MRFTFGKMKLFKRRDKHKNGLSNGLSGDPDEQRYLAFNSPTEPQFTITDDGAGHGAYANGSSSMRSRGYRALKGLGGGGGGVDHRRGSGSKSECKPEFGSRSGSAPTSASAHLLHQLPDAALARVFGFVCAHSQDRSYEKCEETTVDTGCMLCDMRDLAQCVRVCRRWRAVAELTLYTSIRIDAVHYCEREAILSDKRKRRSFFDRNADPEDTAKVRLKLLCRTLRDDNTQRLAVLVQYLKIPYMLRESTFADIARTVAVLPNLRYVDLPDGVFMDDPVFYTLKIELQAKCANLRKMTYIAGAERSLEALAHGALWRHLEVLDLVKIAIDPIMFRHVLGALVHLRALKVTEAPAGPHAFSDDVLTVSAAEDAGFVPDIPPLEELILTDTALVTAAGLQAYLSRPDVRHTLRVLTISGTGAKAWSLPAILGLATSLRHLTLVDAVSLSLPLAAGTKDIPPLQSRSLRTLNYEIKAADGVSPYAGVTRSYYNYLSGSILSGGLPSLRAVYVRDAQFPESLLLPPTMPAAAAEFVRRPMSSTSNTGSISSLGSPTSSLGPLQSPVGFLSPHGASGFAQSSPPRKRLSQNPFIDPSASLSASPPPPPSLKPWAAGHNPRFSSNNPFAGIISPRQVETLEVFTKGDDDIDWSSIVVGGGDGGYGGFGGGGGGGGTSSRPVSSYGLGADLGGVGARKSVLINTGAGGFLAVPDPDADAGGGGGGLLGGHQRQGSSGTGELWPRPRSSNGEKKSEKRDLWR